MVIIIFATNPVRSYLFGFLMNLLVNLFYCYRALIGDTWDICVFRIVLGLTHVSVACTVSTLLKAAREPLFNILLVIAYFPGPSATTWLFVSLVRCLFHFRNSSVVPALNHRTETSNFGESFLVGLIRYSITTKSLFEDLWLPVYQNIPLV